MAPKNVQRGPGRPRAFPNAETAAFQPGHIPVQLQADFRASVRDGETLNGLTAKAMQRIVTERKRSRTKVTAK